MTEPDYRDYKEEQSSLAGGVAERSFRSRSGAVRGRVNLRARRSPSTPEEYSALKASLAAAVQDLREEVRGQHDQTRAMLHHQHVQTRDDVLSTRRDVLNAIRESPAQCLKVISEFCSLFLLFSLAIRFVVKIELVNPAFAVVMLVAFALYWSMAELHQRGERRKNRNNAR